MPRTKVVKKCTDSNETVSQKVVDNSGQYYERVKAMYQQKKEQLLKEKELQIQRYKLHSKQNRCSIPNSVGNRTIADLRQRNNWQTISSLKQGSILNSIMHNVVSEISKKKTSDDGYLTSDSTTETSGGLRRGRSSRRNSATEEPVRKSTRTSRSLSRLSKNSGGSTNQKLRRSRSVCRTASKNRFQTPLNNKKLENFGMVTPKMKPNTPSVVLRRPGQGEIAISLRGSPLMTTAVVSETTANVNIPLADGRMINIQPMRGLRPSEIPDLEPEIQKQLETLRDNLNKVCEMNRNRK